VSSPGGKPPSLPESLLKRQLELNAVYADIAEHELALLARLMSKDNYD
jgi:hypothetical protein